MKRPIALYHGTSSSRLKAILREGLKPRRSNAKGNWPGPFQSHRYVYLSDTFPAFFAVSACTKKTDLPAILRVQVDIEDCLPDEDFIGQMLLHEYRRRGDRSIALEQIHGGIIPEDFAKYAEASLEHMGNVCVPRVTPDAILGHHVFTSSLEALAYGGDLMVTPLARKFAGPRYRAKLAHLFGVTPSPEDQAALDFEEETQAMVVERRRKRLTGGQQ